MSRADDAKRRLRAASERALTVAAMDAMRRKYPDAGTRPPALPTNPFWRLVFAPLYTRVPWPVKQTMMRLGGMTARGWTAPTRRPGTGWEPPRPR
ncbi:MAG: hypothetical protein U0Y82_15560 [Thermoleophilia bacterium]